MRTLNIPIARDRYDRNEEQVFRERIRRAIENSVGRDTLFNPTTGKPIFFGQPHAQAIGTNATFSVAASTLTYLPFPTIQMTHPNLVASGEFKTSFAMDIELNANIYHPAPGGGARTSQYTLYASVYDGSTYLSDFIVGATYMEHSVGWSLGFSAMVKSLGVNFIRLRLTHNDSGSEIFDLTKSWFNIKQLGADPSTGPTL